MERRIAVVEDKVHGNIMLHGWCVISQTQNESIFRMYQDFHLLLFFFLSVMAATPLE